MSTYSWGRCSCMRSGSSVSSPSIAALTALVGDFRSGAAPRSLRRPRTRSALPTTTDSLALLRLLRSTPASQLPLAVLVLVLVLVVISDVVSLPPNNGAVFDLFGIGEVATPGEDRGGSGRRPRCFCREGAWRFSIALVRGATSRKRCLSALFSI